MKDEHGCGVVVSTVAVARDNGYLSVWWLHVSAWIPQAKDKVRIIRNCTLPVGVCKSRYLFVCVQYVAL